MAKLPPIAPLSIFPDGELEKPGKGHERGLLRLVTFTREIFISCGNKYTGIAEFAGRDVITLADAADEFVCFSFKVPDDFVSFSSLDVMWRSSSSGTAGQDWVCDPLAYYSADGETFAAHSDAPSNTTIDIAALVYTYKTNIGFTLPNLAKGDMGGVQLFRRGNDGADSYTSNIHIIGLLFTYIAEQ